MAVVGINGGAVLSLPYLLIAHSSNKAVVLNSTWWAIHRLLVMIDKSTEQE